MAVPFQRESEETDRLLELSDGVIAIAITLLVLDITVPTVPGGTPAAALPGHIFERWHEFLGFVLSFLVIGMYWILHRRIFVHFERHDKGILWLNLLFLLMVAFVPFATSVFTTYPNQFGVIVYSAVLALTGFTLFALWVYASWKNLVEEGLGSRTVRIQAARFLSSPLVFVLSILVAVFDFELAILAWLLLVPLNAVLQSRLVQSVEESVQESESRSVK